MCNKNQLNQSTDMVVGVVGGGRPSTDMVVGVVGGGPAGLMAAGTAAMQGAKVLLFEKNDSCGRKLLITGSGKCNITNSLPLQEFLDGFFENKKFLYPALNMFSQSNLLEFFGNYNVSFKTVDNFKIFPETERADTILSALLSFCHNEGVEILPNSKVLKIDLDDSNLMFKITTETKDFYCDRVIIATGGLSYPTTGSTGDGYTMARELNHKIVSTRPALVGLKTDNKLLSELSGVSLRDVKVSLVETIQKSVLATQTGDVLFTHTGFSGPCILNLSRYLPVPDSGSGLGLGSGSGSCSTSGLGLGSASGSCSTSGLGLGSASGSCSTSGSGLGSASGSGSGHSLQIDLFPNKSKETLDKEVIDILSSNPKKELKTALSKSLGIPVSFAGALMKLCNFQSEILCREITKEQRRQLLQNLKSLSIPVASTQGYEKAMITAGGVATSEINPKTMESKLVKGLYFAGEIIDIDGITGGYNLQVAFSTGFLAGKSAGST